MSRGTRYNDSRYILNFNDYYTSQYGHTANGARYRGIQDSGDRGTRVCCDPWVILRKLARTSIRRSIMVVGMLYFLLLFSCVSTVALWKVLSDATTDNAPKSHLRGGNAAESKHQLRSVRDWNMEFPDVNLNQIKFADMFNIQPAKEQGIKGHKKDAMKQAKRLKRPNDALRAKEHEEIVRQARDQVEAIKQAKLLKEQEKAYGQQTRKPADIFANGEIKTEDFHPRHDVRTSSNSTSVCPEYDIPNLIIKPPLNLSDVPMAEAETSILGDKRHKIQRLVDEANQDLRKIREVVNTPLNETCDMVKGECSKWGYYSKAALDSYCESLDNYMYTPGGIWTPTDCLPRWKVAIIIPYRDRSVHLPIILRHLIPMLQRQRLQFGFFIVEQANNLKFNRAMLMNVGFIESLNFNKWDCFIFHDVDHIPKSDLNYYGCSRMPRLFISGADRWNYKLAYDDFFGAVTGLSRTQVFQINGFPNVYWGWSGEDDEIHRRVQHAELEVSRIKGPRGYYDVIKHHHTSAPRAENRHTLLRDFQPRLKTDGLNNLKYKTPIITLHALYSNISVDIQKLKVETSKAQVKTTSKAQKKLAAKPAQRSKVAPGPPAGQVAAAKQAPGSKVAPRQNVRQGTPVKQDTAKPAPGSKMAPAQPVIRGDIVPLKQKEKSALGSKVAPVQPVIRGDTVLLKQEAVKSVPGSNVAPGQQVGDTAPLKQEAVKSVPKGRLGNQHAAPINQGAPKLALESKVAPMPQVKADLAGKSGNTGASDNVAPHKVVDASKGKWMGRVQQAREAQLGQIYKKTK